MRLVLLLAVVLAACSVPTGPVPTSVVVATESTGTLVVSWTIEMEADPSACTRAKASAVRVELTTAAGSDAGSYEQSCTAFSTTIRLEPDTYQGSAVILDELGAPLTASEQVRSFTILGGDVITTPIDFSITTFPPN
jgi:hypothetical protein